MPLFFPGLYFKFLLPFLLTNVPNRITRLQAIQLHTTHMTRLILFTHISSCHLPTRTTA